MYAIVYSLKYEHISFITITTYTHSSIEILQGDYYDPPFTEQYTEEKDIH